MSAVLRCVVSQAWRHKKNPFLCDFQFSTSSLVNSNNNDVKDENGTHPALLGSLSPPDPSKVLNFSPGPASLPLKVQSAILASLRKPGLNSMFLSHRSPEFVSILRTTLQKIRSVMNIPESHEILFTHGGGHGQFAAVPLNLCASPSVKATYIVNGTWSERAVLDAEKYCDHLEIIKNSHRTDCNYTSFPDIAGKVAPDSKFVYLCSNETVNGIEVFDLPSKEETGGVPLVVDASSDFSSKPICWDNVGVLFACASKNIGHPGTAVTVIRKDLLGNPSSLCPGVLDWTKNIEGENLWNTIATFNVEVVGHVMDWIKENGGVKEMENRSVYKSNLIYKVIDESGGFYSTNGVEIDARSRMNVPFNVAGGDEALTNKFLIDAWEKHNIVGLRTLTPFGVGEYLRASLYHGVEMNQATALAEYMHAFAKANR